MKGCIVKTCCLNIPFLIVNVTTVTNGPDGYLLLAAETRSLRDPLPSISLSPVTIALALYSRERERERERERGREREAVKEQNVGRAEGGEGSK